jgi:hypothetical protein
MTRVSVSKSISPRSSNGVTTGVYTPSSCILDPPSSGLLGAW